MYIDSAKYCNSEKTDPAPPLVEPAFRESQPTKKERLGKFWQYQKENEATPLCVAKGNGSQF